MHVLFPTALLVVIVVVKLQMPQSTGQSFRRAGARALFVQKGFRPGSHPGKSAVVAQSIANVPAAAAVLGDPVVLGAVANTISLNTLRVRSAMFERMIDVVALLRVVIVAMIDPRV